MIRIVKKNGVTLEPAPGSSIEIERNSPFFSLGDEWAGETSSPMTWPYSAVNEKEQEHQSTFYTKRSKKIEDADLYDGTYYRQRGKLISDTGTFNQNHIHKSEQRGYFVFGLSNFFQIIKDKKLRSLSLDGVKNFNWTSNNPTDGSAGFWQYLHSTFAGTEDFVVAPIRNEEYDDSIVVPIPGGGTLTITCDWINRIGTDYKLDYNLNLATNSICPQIRMKYILEKIFNEHGYSVIYDVEDVQWESLFLVSLIPFKWQHYIEYHRWPYIDAQPLSSVQIKLSEHLPDRTISDFLIQLGNRYGWRYLINDETKTCKIKAVRTILKGTKKDWTSYSTPVAESDTTGSEKIFAFKNDIDSGDSLPLQNDFTGKTMLPGVFSFGDLPTASGVLLKNVCHTYIENTYWIVESDEATNSYKWVPFADNIFNYEPDGETDDISTTLSTLPVAWTNYVTVSSVPKYGLFPMMKQKVKSDFGFRCLFYHGVVPDQLADGTFSGGSYPHLSSLWRAPGPTADKIWSNVYVHDYNDVKRGVIEYWFKTWLQIISNGEDLKITMNLPRNVLVAFNWDDIIMIKNIPFLVKSIIEPLPYKNKIQATLRRIG